MNQVAALRRHLSLIRLLMHPYAYPSQARIRELLEQQGFDPYPSRTFERDKGDLRHEYGAQVVYDRDKGGYYLQLPVDEDPEDFNTFVRLLERRERLDLLGQSTEELRKVSHYLELEQNTGFVGLDLLAQLWQALRGRREVRFTYQPYNGGEAKVRTVECGLVLEYRNRFYLVGWDTDRNALRTFGIDRIRELALTGRMFATDRTAECRSFRQHVVGVTAPADREPERVVLRFTAQEGWYVKSLPLHASQRVTEDTADGLTVELHVVPNHELEREILAYGEEAEVLEPPHLRDKLAERLKQAARHYV